MTGNALLPRYDRIGTPLKKDRQTPRPRAVGKIALGAIPKDKKRRAAIIDDEMRKLFARMTNAHYRKKRTASLRFVHDQIVGHLMSVARVDQDTGRIVIDRKRSELARKGIPTFRQYHYWYQTSGRKLQDDIARVWVGTPFTTI